MSEQPKPAEAPDSVQPEKPVQSIPVPAVTQQAPAPVPAVTQPAPSPVPAMTQPAPAPVPAVTQPAPAPAAQPEPPPKPRKTAESLLASVFASPPRPKSHLDVIKILAIILVLLSHTGSNFYTQYVSDPNIITRWLKIAHSSFSKIAVPLFFMCSGALLLGRSEPYSKLLKKRVLRFVITLAVVSGVIYVMGGKGDEKLSVLEYLSLLYQGDIANHLWYLYAYIGFLLTIPFLRMIAQRMEEKDFYWLIVLQLITSLFSFADYFFFRGHGSLESTFTLFTAVRPILYPLLGYYIENKMPKEKFGKDGMFLTLMLTLFTLYLTCVMMEWRCNVDDGWTSKNQVAYLETFNVFPSIMVFYGLKLWFIRHPASDFMGKVLFHLGSYTFGVYLFDSFFRKWAKDVQKILKPVTGIYIATWVMVLAAVLMGMAATFGYKTLVGLMSAAGKRIFTEKEGSAPGQKSRS